MMYKRKHRVVVETKGGDGLDVSNLRCVFTIEKAVKDDPQYAEVGVYNLSEELENVIIEKGSRVIVEAGYEDEPYGLIYAGDILQAFREKEDGIDIKLVLVCQDGDEYLNHSFIAKTLSKGADSQEIIDACTNDGSVTAEQGVVSPELSQQKLARGKVMFGQSKDYLRKAAKSNEAQYYVEDGKVHVIKAADVEKGTAIELNPSTGLLGTPAQIEDGVSGECLLNPQIRLNTLLHIDSSLVTEARATQDTKKQAMSTSGVYRAVKLTYEGDTHGDAWTISFEALSQAGSVPSLLKDGATNPWR